MEEMPNEIKEYGDKLEKALADFTNIAIRTKDQTFWEKFAPILLPTIISTMIGVATFFAAFNLSEYKIGVLMEERVEIKRSIKGLETKLVSIDLVDHANSVFIEYTKKTIDDIREDIEVINSFEDRHRKEDDKEFLEISYRLKTLEKRVEKICETVIIKWKTVMQ